MNRALSRPSQSRRPMSSAAIRKPPGYVGSQAFVHLRGRDERLTDDLSILLIETIHSHCRAGVGAVRASIQGELPTS